MKIRRYTQTAAAAVILTALATLLLRAQVYLDPPIITGSNTLRLVVNGPTTNIRYDVYFTNALSSNAASWPLLVTGGTNQVIFDLTIPDTNAGFFIVTSNYFATSNPPPQVATPAFSPSSFTGNTSVTVTVTCDTPGAAIYYTSDGDTPTISDNYIASGGNLLIQCATTLKARAFRSGFLDSEVATGTYNVNCPPSVFAGDQQITAGSQVTLQGVAWDDGQTQAVSNYWRQISGPATVTFGNRNATNSTATLPANGIYVLQLESFDGFWTSSSRVTVARDPAITIALTAPSGGSTFGVPTNIVLEAAASTTSGSITQVQFYAGGLLIGTDTAAPFTYDWRNVPAGNLALYAVATSTDPNNFSLASSAVSITVNFPSDIGRFTLAATDLQIPVAGLPIIINRSHDPRHGSGWSFGQNARLDYEEIQIRADSMSSGWEGSIPLQWCVSASASHVVTITLASGDNYYFSPRVVFNSTGNGCINAANPNGYNGVFVHLEFDALGGRGGELSLTVPANLGLTPAGYDPGDGCLGSWASALELATFEEDGLEICGAVATTWEPSLANFTFTAPNGTQYKFDSDGKLYQRIDRNNNSLTYTSSGITHSSGKQVTFTRDGGSRITEIKDPIAIAISGVPAIKYSFDSSGHLTNVARLVSRGGAGTYENTAYRYEDGSNPHLITRVIDARGITTVSNLFDANGRLSRQYDALGNYTSYTYEDNGRRQVVTDKNNRTTRYDLTEAGQVESVQDAENAVTSFAYDANGRRIAEFSPIGATNSYAYNERDDPIGATNELSFSSSATYDTYGKPLTLIDAMGYGTTNAYDSEGNLVAVTNALSIISRYGYDGQGNLRTETNAFGLNEQTVTQYDSDQFGYITNVTDALGSKTSFTYDANGNRLTERRERTLASGSKQVLWLTNQYDAANRNIAVIEPDGFTNRTVFNAIGKVAYSTNKLGVVTRHDYDPRALLTNTVFALGTTLQANEAAAYDAEGRRTNSVDRAGRATAYTYDGVGRVRRTTFPDGAYTENQYDAAGRLYATVQGPRPNGGTLPPPAGFTTRFQYDAAGRRTAVTDAFNQTNSYGYDRNGNQTNFVDALNRTTRYGFDWLNRQVKATFSDNTSESYGYDGINRRVALTNQANIVTRFGYDKVSRLTAATNGWGTGTSNWVTYAYDEVGNQTNQLDTLSRMTRHEYDSMGRRARTVLPGAQSEGFAYDSAGNLTRHTNFNSVIITNRYDALNRLTNQTSVSGYQIRYTYSPTGQRATMTDASGNYTFAYDSRDRMLTNSGPAGTLVYTYDIYGRLASINSQRLGGASLSYQYDSLNRLTNVIDAVAGSALYAFDGVGNLQTLRYPNAVTNTYTYDALNRLTNLVAKASGGTLASFAYKLAAAGNRTNLTETVNNANRTFGWSYDVLYRLTNEVISGTAPTGSIGYKYDAVGNRTNRTSSVAGVTNQTFSYNGNDRLTTDTYDNNGSTTASAGNSYAYDVAARLTNFNSGAATFTYNGDGIRVSKTASGTTTLYLVDDRNPTGYAQVLEELTVSGGTTNLSRVYTYGLDLIAQRGVSTGVRSFYGYDGNGTTRFLTATNGTITDTYVYDAFGILLTNTGTTVNYYRYTGEQYDANLGFYYLRARYANPGTGRFWTMDTFQGNLFDPASLHRYTYCADNPVNCIDPSGQEFNVTSLLTAVSTASFLAAQQASALVSRLGPAFAAGGRQLGLLFQEFGALAQNTALQIIRMAQTAAPNLQLEINAVRGSRIIDFVVSQGQRIAQIEVKYGIPRRAGEALTRLVAQVEAATAHGQGQIVLWTLREPTQPQLALVTRELGANASRVKFVHGVEGLFQWLQLYFGL